MIKDFRAAIVTGVLTITFSLSTSALIFQGPLHQYFGFGLAAALTSSAVVAIVTACFSGFRFAVASPNSGIAAGIAATIVGLSPVLAVLAPQQASALILTVVLVTTLVTGATLMALGVGRMGAIVRFVPFSVVAGFLAISGWLLVIGSLRLTTQLPLTLASISAPLPANAIGELGMLFTWTLFLIFMKRAFKVPELMPSLFIGGVLAANGAIAMAGVPRDSPQLLAVMFHADTLGIFDHSIATILSVQIEWINILHLAPGIVAVIFITVLTALLTFSGLENAMDVDGNLDHELVVQGAGNLLSGLCGGSIAIMAIGQTLTARAMGAQGRMTGIIIGLMSLAVLLGAQEFINYVPRFIIGGLILQVGSEILWTWCIATRKKMPRNEWLLVIGILAIAIWFGFIPAIVIGILGGCIIFAIDISRVDVVRRIYGINDRGSPLVRSGEEIAVLARLGVRVKIIELNGFVFFGSAHQMLLRTKALIQSNAVDMIIVDFTTVTGCDSSAATVLVRLVKMLRRAGITPVLAAVRADVLALLALSGVIDSDTRVLADRNSALEFAEMTLLAGAGLAARHTIPLVEWLATSLGSADFAKALVPMLHRADVAAGTYICRQGEPTDTLLFIESGRVGVMIGTRPSEVCIRIFGAHTIAGEQGFILEQPRSASLKAETDARVWTLERSAFDLLKANEPALVIALMRDIVRVQSERLVFANRQNNALA